MSSLPYLTLEYPALAAVIRRTDQDFRVDELPLYEPEGEGDHVFFLVEKRGLTTPTLVRLVAAALDKTVSSIGFAGLKDAHAVTRQHLSVEHVTPEAVGQLRIDGAEVLWAKRHRNKLRRGHLSGNRFRIVLRDCDATRADEVCALLQLLQRVGMPNAFGPQRYGARGDTAKIGHALIGADHDSVVRQIAGRPGEADYGAVKQARESFERGDYAVAAREWPRGYEIAGKICAAMARHRGRASRAVRVLSKRERSFFVSAWQSRLFDRVLAERMPQIDRLLEDEYAWNHGSRRSFEVRDLGAESERAARFEVSPAGPLPGPALRLARGRAGEIEQRVLSEAGVELDRLDPRRFCGITGGRRPFRVQPTDIEVRTLDTTTLELDFRLPAGSYATSLLREVCKERAVDESRPTPVGPPDPRLPPQKPHKG